MFDMSIYSRMTRCACQTLTQKRLSNVGVPERLRLDDFVM